MRRLHKLKANEISLTRAAANRRVFALYKSAKGGPMSEPTPEQVRDEVRKSLVDVDEGVLSQLDSIIAKAEQDGGRELSPRAAGVIKAIGRLLAPHAGEIQSSDIMAACKAAGLDSAKAADAMGKAAKDPDNDGDDDEDEADTDGDEAELELEAEEDEGAEDDDAADDEDDEDDEDAVGAKKSANIAPKTDLSDHRNVSPTAKAAQAELKTEPKGGSVKKGTEAPVEKSANFEEMRKHNAELAAQVEDLRKHCQEQEALRKAEQAARDLHDITKSVEENYGHLSLDAKAVAPALKTLKDLEDKSHYDAMMAVLNKSADYSRRMEGPSGLFKSFGHSRSNSVSLGAQAELDDLVKSARSLPENATKTEAQVYRDIVKSAQGRELKQRIRQEEV